MFREDSIQVEGIVIEVLSDRLYRVELANGHRLLGHLPRIACSVLRDGQPAQYARGNTFCVGDKVTVQMSPFDFSKGRIRLERT